MDQVIDPLPILLMQMTSTDDLQANIFAIEDLITKANPPPGTLVLLPENALFFGSTLTIP